MGEAVDLFADFFRAVHGVEPFAWQRALAARVMEGPGWPRAVAVPTGLGKTAAIDIAVVALAWQSKLPPHERTAPTRTFFVVDRRLLVDQAFERAMRIARALEAPQDEAVRRVAEGLRRVGGGERPLEVVRMRGGATWSWRWVSSPAQPAIVTATVDQFGSRLLFRGYGVGPRLRPIDAALCGRDALVLLDEAHLATALAETLRRARLLEAGAESPVLSRRAPEPVLLSATLADAGGGAVVRADPDAESSEEARRRFSASRSVSLYVVEASGRDGEQRLARGLTRLAALALQGGEVDRVAVVVNTVARARAVFEELRSALGEQAQVELLIGRCRGFERDQLGLGARIRATFGAVPTRPPAARPAVLVATQTIEVGADLDVDSLVTEAAPLDALVQRLGRLNRLGTRERGEAACVFADPLHRTDPVYGERTVRTWEWLCRHVSAAPAVLDPWRSPTAEAATLEVGLRALGSLVTPQDLRECAAETPLVPVLVAPHLDAWARTSPAPDPDQPVEPFLHGLDRGSAEVSVCWRAPLPSVDAWRVELEAVPIRDEERVEVPIWAARRFLRRLGPGPLADLETVSEAGEEAGAGEPPSAVVQRVDGSVERLQDPTGLRPGDTVILDPGAGGHDPWGWTGDLGSGPVADVADLVPRRRPVLRLRPGVLAWATGEDASAFRQRLAEAEASPRELAAELLGDAIARARSREDADPVLHRWVEHAERMREELAAGRASVMRMREPGDGGYFGLLVQQRAQYLSEEGSDEGEATTSVAPVPVPLSRHARQVSRRARAIGEHLGLEAGLVRAVELAGLLHDAGKADIRFQVMLHRGDPDRLEASGLVLAKSGMDPSDRAALRRAREGAGLPEGWRHEAVSLAICEAALEEEPGVDAALVRHLVAAHHGWGRPLFRPLGSDLQVRLVPIELDGLGVDASLGEVDVDHVGWASPRRFATLCRRYGWWGLALLESIVRLADMAVSEEGQ